MAKCEKCGRVMNIIHWGRGKDMAICINSACALYRQPCSNPFLSSSASKPLVHAKSDILPGHEVLAR
jgi:hypothetical protein